MRLVRWPVGVECTSLPGLALNLLTQSVIPSLFLHIGGPELGVGKMAEIQYGRAQVPGSSHGVEPPNTPQIVM